MPDAYPTIQLAIDASSNGDTVLVSPGTYHESPRFGSKEIALRSTDGPSATTIDGNYPLTVIRIESGQSASTVVDGFTVRDGNGGIYVEDSSPTIVNNIIENNYSCSGSGLTVRFSASSIRNNVIRDNLGGYLCAGGVAGGVSIGGAGSVDFSQNVVIGNSVNGLRAGGLQIFAAGYPRIIGNVIAGNRVMRECCSPTEGGGIWMANTPTALIANNVIYDNQADEGGGVRWLIGSGSDGPILLNNTIVHNIASKGSAVLTDGFEETTRIVNNILVSHDSTAALECDPIREASPPIVSHNIGLAEGGAPFGGSCALLMGTQGNLEVDPALQDPGSDDYRLGAGSPAVDAGDTSIAELPPTDFEGDRRVLDGDNDALALVDIGADETTDQDGDGVLPPNDICPFAAGPPETGGCPLTQPPVGGSVEVVSSTSPADVRSPWFAAASVGAVLSLLAVVFLRRLRF